MKALVKRENGPGLHLEEVPIPEPGEREVRVRVRHTAICGTDVHIYKWDAWAAKTIPVPLVIGHEFVGHIDAVGCGVRSYAVGDRVTAEGHIICGQCRNCLTGRGHNCQASQGLGVNRQGAFAEYIVVPESNLWALPDEIPDEVAACFDPLGNAVHTALSFDLRGEDVLITGAGPLGLMGAAIARFCGAKNVVVSDVNPKRLQLAKQFGAQLVNPGQTSIRDFARSIGVKEGFDVGLEMSGNPTAFHDMTHNMIHGGKIALLGLFREPFAVDWNEHIFNGLIFKGVSGREMFDTWYKMTALVQAGLDIRPVITHRMPYTEYERAFETILAGDSGKIVLRWN
ncbi:MAG: L-threonine 3-dehydrogenase [Spirochaetota bacterium]